MKHHPLLIVTSLLMTTLTINGRQVASELIAGDIDLAPTRRVERGLGTSPVISSVAEPEIAPPGILRLGAGYNALTGQVLPGVCVASAAPNLEFGRAQLGGTINHRFINTVSDMASNASATGSSAGFSFTYKLISLGFNTGSDSEGYFNSVDQFARIYVRMATQGEALTGEGWSPLGAIEIRNSRRRFTDICGTHYIRAIYRGHVLDQSYRFRLRSNNYAANSRNSFSLGIGKLFGFDYSDTKNEQSIAEMSSMTLTDDSRGIATPITADTGSPTGVSALVRYAREGFANAVIAARPDQASPILYELVPYYQLPATGSGSVPRWPDEIMTLVSSRVGLYQDFLTVLSDLNFASRLSDSELGQVYEDTRDAVVTKQTAALNMQTAIRNAVRTCVDLLGRETDDTAARTRCETDLNNALSPRLLQNIRLRVKAT